MSPHWQPANSDLPVSGVTAGTYGDATHVGQVTVAASGLVTAASNVVITGGGGGGGGGELGYTQITSSVLVTSTTEASGTTIITCGAVTFDGAPVMVEFSAPAIELPTATNATNDVVVSLFEGATQIGRLCVCLLDDLASGQNYRVPACGRLRFTPTAASHTYKVTAFASSTTGSPSVDAGAGGTGVVVPAFCRFTKV